MADGKRDWYGKDKGKGKSKDKEESKPASMEEKHAAERGETHQRHAKARDDLHKQHQEELMAMAARHADEAQQQPGGNDGAPAAESPVQGAAGGTPPAVAGAQMPQGAAA
jgi:hypothetical protein